MDHHGYMKKKSGFVYYT